MKFYSTEKRCASCRFWNGPRKYDYVSNLMEASLDNSARGDCAPQRFVNKSANDGCNKWEKDSQFS